MIGYYDDLKESTDLSRLGAALKALRNFPSEQRNATWHQAFNTLTIQKYYQQGLAHTEQTNAKLTQQSNKYIREFKIILWLLPFILLAAAIVGLTIEVTSLAVISFFALIFLGVVLGYYLKIFYGLSKK